MAPRGSPARAALAVAGLMAGQASAQDLRGDWPGEGGGPGRTGAIEAWTLGPLASHTGMAWAVALPAPVASGVVITGSLALVADTRGTVHAVDVLTGCLAWRADLGEPVVAAPAAADGGFVVAGREGALLAGSCGDGVVRWRVGLGAGVQASPVAIADGWVLVSADGRARALAVATGAERWRAAMGAPVFASPAAGDGRVVVIDVDGVVRCLEAGTGAATWEARAGGGPCYAAPAVQGGRVYTVAGDGTVSAFALATGVRRFRASLQTRTTASPAVQGGRVFVIGENGTCRAFDGETGATVWEHAFGTPGPPFRAGLLAGNDWLIVSGDDGWIRFRGVASAIATRPPLDPGGGQQPLPAAPALHPGGLVGVRADGWLFAQREPWADGRVAEVLLGLVPTVDPVEVALAAQRLRGPGAAAAALALCRAGLQGHQVAGQLAATGRAELRAAAAEWREHLSYLERWITRLQQGLARGTGRDEPVGMWRARRRRLWRTFLDHERPDVVAAALARWRADGGIGLAGFDPLWPVAKRRRLVAELTE